MSRDLAGQELLARVDELIGPELVEADAVFDAELASWHPYVTDVLAHVTRFRGKRLRPILLLTTALASGGIRREHKVLAAVVEMIHTATLIHDDVLDDATTRRHVATVNARWNNETSVLCGDYLFTHAFHLTASLDSALACRLIGRATNMVCEGELSQIHERGNLELDEDTYFRIINGKTAELCALCCFLGGHFAEMDEPVVLALQEYGRNLGLAFQVADDLLDIQGSEVETGKSLGTDFKKQKLTLPVIRLLNQADAETRLHLRELLNAADEASWHELRSCLERSDAIPYALARSQEFVAAARGCLDCLPPSPARRLLEEMAEFACQRSF